MKTLLFVLALSLVNSSNAQTTNDSWYQCLKGTIGNDSITMHLHKANEGYNGFYYYHKNQEALFFCGYKIDNADSIGLSLLMEKIDYGIGVALYLRKQGNQYIGQWLSEGGVNDKGVSKNKETKLFKAKVINVFTSNFDLVATGGSIKLRPDLNNSPQAHYEAYAVWPKYNNLQNTTYIKSVIRGMVGGKNSASDLKHIFSANQAKFFKEEKNHLKNERKDMIEEYRNYYDAGKSVNINIIYQAPKIISLSHYASFSNGIRVCGTTKFIALDLVNKRKLSLKSILTTEGIKKLSHVVKKEYLIGYEGKNRFTQAFSTEDPKWLIANPIQEPEKGFYITAKGIGFNCTMAFDECSHSSLHIIFIPFAKLKNYLQPAFKKLIQ